MDSSLGFAFWGKD